MLFCSWQSPWRPKSEDVSDVQFGLCVFGMLERLTEIQIFYSCSPILDVIFIKCTDSIFSQIQRRTSAGHQLVGWFLWYRCNTPGIFSYESQDDISYDYSMLIFNLILLLLSCFLNLICNSYIDLEATPVQPFNRFASSVGGWWYFTKA